MKHPEEIDPDWARYAETVLVFGVEPPLELDLRESPVEGVRVRFKNMGFGNTFSILTAHDPYGRDLSAEENRERQAQLEGRLTADAVPFVRVDACSVDREHCECSVAIDVSQERATAIASEYEQMAIFWYDGESFWLFGAMVESDPIRLPRSA